MSPFVRVLAIALCLATAAAWAQSPEQLARTHYDAAHALFRVGNYEQAAKEFMAAYELTPRPRLLINAGLAYAKNQDPGRARECYQRFLAIAPEDDAERASVSRLLAELPPTPPRVAPPPPPAVALAAPPPPPRKSFARRHWWIFPVVGVVAAGGLATGLYFALRPRCGAGLGCVEFPP